MAQYTQEQYNQDLSTSWKKHVATRLRTELPDIPGDASDDDVLGYVRDTEIPQDATPEDVNKFFYDKYSTDWEPPKPPKPSLGEMALNVGKSLGQGIALFGGAHEIGKIAAKAAKSPIGGPVAQAVAAAPSAVELGGAAIAGKKMEEQQANFPRLTPEHLRQVNKQLMDKNVPPDVRQMLIHRYTLNLTRGYDAAQSSLANDIIETGKEGVHKAAEAAANAAFLPVGANALEKFIGATMAKSAATKAIAPIVSGAAGGAVLGAGFGGATSGISAGAQAAAGEMHPAEEGKAATPPGPPLEEAVGGALHGAVDGFKWGASLGAGIGVLGSLLGAAVPWAARIAASGADRKAELAPKLDIGESVYPELAPEKGAAAVPLGVAQPVGASLAPEGGLAHEATPPGLAGPGVEPTSPKFVPPAQAAAAPAGLEGAEHGKAQSAAALKEVLSQADAAGAPVEVQASEYVGKRGGTIPAEKVAAWYEKQGFKRVPGTGDAITLMHTPPAADALSTKQLGELALYHLGDTDEARLNSFMDRVEGLSKEKVQEATGNVTEGQQIAKGGWADELGSKLDGAAKLAAERLNAKRGRLTAGIDPTDLSDLVTIGAAKMYRLGLTRFKPWAEEMVRDYGEPIQAHLKELFARTQKFMKDRIERANVSFARAKTLLTMAKQGEAGANWYNETKNWTDENFGPDSDMMLRFLSATSAGMSTDANVSLAMRAYAQWKLGLPFDNYLGVHKNMLEAAVRGEAFGDRKIQSILAALRGDENAVVIDRRVMRTLGFKMAGKSKTGEGILGAQGSLTDKQYELFEGVIRDLAKQSNMSPREFQAALWTANKIEEAQGAKTPREVAYVGSFRPYEQIVSGKLEKLTPAQWVSRNRVTVEQMAAANEGVNATRAGEGWTYNPHNFNAYTGKKGIVVTLASAKIPTKELTGSTVIDFGNRFRRLVASFYGTTIGTFNLEKYEKGMSSIDFNIVMPESMRDRAIELGKARRQHSLWDLDKGEEIATGFKGKSYEPPKKGAAAFWAQEIKNLDKLMARLDIPSRSMHQSDMFNATTDRVPSSLDYWGIEAEQVMPKAIRSQFENAQTGDELTELVQKYGPELAGPFKDAKLSASREDLGTAADDLQQYYAKKNGIEMPEPEKQAGDQIPNGSGLNRGTLEAMARTPHRWLTYAAEALGKSEGDIRQMVDDGTMKPMSEAGMLNKVEIHKDGLVWEYTDPTAPSYNIMKLIGRLGGKMGPATLAKLEGKDILSGHDVLASYKGQAGFLSLGTSQYKAVEGLLKKNLTSKIEDSMVRNGGNVVDNINAFRNQRHMGTSLWIGQDGRVIRVHFHLRNAARVSDDLKLQNPVEYEGPEHSDQQTILNYGFVRVQMHDSMLAVDATAPLSAGQKRVLRELMRKSTTGDREFRGRVVNPNGEHRSFTESYPEFVTASDNPQRITVKG